jgi:hypothetical protein
MVRWRLQHASNEPRSRPTDLLTVLLRQHGCTADHAAGRTDSDGAFNLLTGLQLRHGVNAVPSVHRENTAPFGSARGMSASCG